ncbi:MAG TPA: prepilin-type N-terminal cleavage/methylation domain-containing protein [Longimicrobiales bacterium]|nr:prepilin-type N-terminal cleavage/methylation domain-containing protein [Longimicrobiales bacterium]
MVRRDGFTMVEILMALLLLSFVVLGFQAATGEIIHYAAQSDRELVAVQLAEDRLELIRLDPAYDSLEARYDAPEATLSGFPGLSRNTVITRTLVTDTLGILDYHRITVTVDGAALREPVARTIVVAAP